MVGVVPKKSELGILCAQAVLTESNKMTGPFMEGFTLLLEALCTGVMFWFPLFLLSEMNQSAEALSVWLERLTISKMTKE